MNYFFAVNLKWKSIPLPKADRVIETAKIEATANRKPQLLGKLNLEITLNTSVANSIIGGVPPGPGPNERLLSDAAFRTRSFTVTIEKGNFTPDHWIEYKGSLKQRWGLRLLFDKSPYPAREGFKDLHGGPLGLDDELAEITTFLARPLPDSETRGKAMNDDSYAGFLQSCSVS
jgi:hypothetical protein